MKELSFIAKNWKNRVLNHPLEESYSINNEIGTIAVADGVTRDPFEYLPDISTLKGKLKFSLNYPRPSPAKIASDIFTQTFQLILKDFVSKDDKAIKEVFNEANKRIKNWNDKNMTNSDYIMRDYAGCVASGTIKQKGVISWGFITDCGVAIFNEKGILKFKTNDENPHQLERYMMEDPKIKGKTWNNPEVRSRIRSYYRNNPKNKYSYGVLTGQQEAMDYVRTGTQEIGLNDYLIVYTDGLEPIIFSEDFSNKLKEKDIKVLESLCKKRVKTEGTLVLKQY